MSLWSRGSLDRPIIETGFPGGNAVIERVDADRVLLRQDQRDSVMPWFFWRFAVRGAGGRTLTFEFTDWDVIGTQGPCVSRDGGLTWNWLGRACVEGPTFRYSFGADEDRVEFCFCIPYLQAQLDRFLAGYPEIRRGVLCLSPEGREVERLDVGREDAPRVLVTCRHHACESPGSYVLEGLLREWCRRKPEEARLTAIPFVDKDGVENGDQGKERNGRDHNRDYDDAPRYAETRALMRLVGNEGAALVYLDLHAPWIRGDWHQRICLVGGLDAAMTDRQRAFLSVLAERRRGRLPVTADDFLPHGQDWNTRPPNQHSSAVWHLRAGSRLSSTVEIPYADVRGIRVDAEGFRLFGEDLASAVLDVLEQRHMSITHAASVRDPIAESGAPE